jgi:tRNA threonylcarbamoyladenosine biosynthesis protein TsaE
VEYTGDIIVRSTGADRTARIAAVFSDWLQAGDVLVLGGDLGAGKTTFTKALGGGLGIDETITSPTFTLAHQYDGGRLTLHHLDVYRLESLDEVVDLALPELFEDEAVVVIEWGDTITAALPSDYLLLRFEFGRTDDERFVRIGAVGQSWSERMNVLHRGLQPFVTDMVDT